MYVLYCTTNNLSFQPALIQRRKIEPILGEEEGIFNFF